jgi:rhamnose transport system ATP-binding protein
MAGVGRADLIRLMVGREVTQVFPKREVEHGPVRLELRDVRGVSLQVRRGEILGLAGLVGAGRTELARTLFGLDPAPRGEILLDGVPVRVPSPAAAIELGIAYVPEDRRRHGVILEMPVAANASLAVLRRLCRHGFLDFDRERALAGEAVARLQVKTPSIDTPVGHLSGGNQQKVALARWLATEPRVLILDEPTQGIDVGAKSEIHALMGELAAKGLAIVMISSELPEVLGMSDRVAVLYRGRLAGVLDRTEATQEKVLALALGHGPEAAA